MKDTTTDTKIEETMIERIRSDIKEKAKWFLSLSSNEKLSYIGILKRATEEGEVRLAEGEDVDKDNVNKMVEWIVAISILIEREALASTIQLLADLKVERIIIDNIMELVKEIPTPMKVGQQIQSLGHADLKKLFDNESCIDLLLSTELRSELLPEGIEVNDQTLSAVQQIFDQFSIAYAMRSKSRSSIRRILRNQYFLKDKQVDLLMQFLSHNLEEIRWDLLLNILWRNKREIAEIQELVARLGSAKPNEDVEQEL